MDSLEEWKSKVYAPAKEKKSERKDVFQTSSDIPLEPVYVDTNKSSPEFPGEYPYTRGIHPTMYRSRLWTMRQYSGFGDAKQSNERYLYLLNEGQTGLSIAFDLPTQMGYDSDDPLAVGEVGKVGVAIDSLVDMEILLKNIPLDKISTSMTINSTASTLLCLYLAVAEKRGIPFEKLRGTIQNDILKEYIARGTYIYPPRPSMRIITDIFEFCHAYVPQWNTISISGYHIREAGSTAVQEIAFTLANGITYVESALKAGLHLDEIAPRLAFFFNVHNHFFEEIAKFRALRRLWAKIMKHRFSAKNPRSMMLRFHSQTAGSTLTDKQPENNIVRVALQSLASICGGTQSLHTNSMDEALGLPTEKSVRIALKTQQIIAHESGVADTIDPLAGSYFIESLTSSLEEKAHILIDKIDDMGGMIPAIEQGFPQRMIQDAAYKTQMAQEKGDEIVVGVNAYRTDSTSPPPMYLDATLEENQCKKLIDMRANRDSIKVRKTLDKLKQKASTKDNLIPHILDCVKTYCTVGEIANTLRLVLGEHKDINM